MFKNIMTYIEQMPRQKDFSWDTFILEILSWVAIIIAAIYFSPVCWRVFTRH